ncbi:hypothetical protein jhhlp_007136 [Lomentospora prolificans]|uniref:Ubiquitin-like domain-containing protein n=1 Tax=Lomentospora prolificans TaxID=41688 RepID=A0A2N3N1T3_9PEZI|nr:hypothetical protein jhhlp_007136 [Lomentospora prolificans]
MSDSTNKKRLPFKPTALRKSAPAPAEKPAGEDDDLALFKRSREMLPMVAKEAERRAQKEKAERDARRRRRSEIEEAPESGPNAETRSPGSSQKKRRTSGAVDSDAEDNDRKLSLYAITVSWCSTSPTQPERYIAGYVGTLFGVLVQQCRGGSPGVTLPAANQLGDDDDLVVLDSPPTKVEDDDFSIIEDTTRSSFREEEEDPELQKYVQAAHERKRQLEQERQQEQAGSKKNFTVEVISDIPYTHMAGPCVFKHFGDDPLKQVRETWCAIMQMHKIDIIANDVFLTWRGNRLYNTTTLQGLGISILGNNLLYAQSGTREGFSEDRKRVILQAWTEDLFETYQQEKERERLRLLGELDDEQEEDAAAPEPEEKIKVTMRPKQGDSVKVSVTASSTVSVLIEKFRAKRHIPQEAKISIHFDGEKLGEEMTLEAADIGDDDQVEVHMG